jgi:RHS repeat-associated protein
VNGVAYTWDNNGNLTNDGVRSYTYDAANRLTAVSGSPASSFGYDGLGNRITMTVSGATTRYALDVASGPSAALRTSLPEVIAATGGATTQYLQVQGQVLAQYDSGTWGYVAPDALGSVRQVVDPAGSVTLAQSYDPFGNLLSSVGSGSSVFGYTGEQVDASTGLVYLRARYYQPGQGRFVAKDAWLGDYQEPQTLNGWNYVEDNPVNLADPSGYGICFSLIGMQNYSPFLTVGQAIAMCQAMFDKENWKRIGVDCGEWCARPWSLRRTIREVSMDYLCEWGPTSVQFGGTHPLTQELARSILIDRERRKFYREGNLPYGLIEFGVGEFAIAWLDAGFSMPGLDVPVTQFLGSFERAVFELPSNRVGYLIHNQTDRASGTHLAGRQRSQGYIYNLEDLVAQNPQLKKEPLSKVLAPGSGYRALSILRAKTRTETIDPEGGGAMQQYFIWSERKLDCPEKLPPWPAYLPFLDIRE